MKKTWFIVLLLGLLLSLSGCGHYDYPQMNFIHDGLTLDEYNKIGEVRFIDTSVKTTSAFSLSASTAAYSNFRSMVLNDRTISPNAIRIEEMINYFSYDYADPSNDEIMSMQASIIPTPWNEKSNLLMIGMKAAPIEKDEIKNNLVFLLDVSGSMNRSNCLPLVQEAFILLLEALGDDDVISIVTYASSDQVLLDGGMGYEKARISAIISDLYASGTTAGAKGIQRAYELAEKHFIEGGNNRVILATDGDFNVGISSPSDLEAFISEKKETGIYLSVLGFGYGNYKDNKLETLASKGNGNHAYIDTILEAKKALIEDINGTLFTVARDAKAQITFNEETVSSFRIIGYENKLLTDEEFDEESTDAGEIGAGHRVTVIYEIKLKESEAKDLGNILLRYKSPTVGEEEIYEQSLSVSKDDIVIEPNEDILFISSIVEVSLVLRNSSFKGTSSFIQARNRINNLNCVENDVYKKEFLSLINKLIDKTN